MFLLLTTASAYFIRKGFSRHVMAGSMTRWSRQKWNEGKYLESANWLMASYESALDAGVRWTIVEGFYLDHMIALRNQNKPNEALETCLRALDILAGSDDEGTLSYGCMQMEGQITGQK